MLEAFGANASDVEDGDLQAISAPIDFLGINNYTRSVVRAAPDGGRPVHVRNPNGQYTDMDWEIAPHAFHDLLVRVHRDYAPPAIYVTENGAAFGDVRGHDGRIRDTERQEYVAVHLDAAARAIAQGVPLQGYFVWSLLDNFEWSWGYWKRFGLVYVDYPTLERIPKESFGWYRDFIAAQRASSERHAASGRA
jgi:beta-glucosidase